MMNGDSEKESRESGMPAARLVGVFGGVSGLLSALLFEQWLYVGIGTGGGIVFLVLMYREWLG